MEVTKPLESPMEIPQSLQKPAKFLFVCSFFLLLSSLPQRQGYRRITNRTPITRHAFQSADGYAAFSWRTPEVPSICSTVSFVCCLLGLCCTDLSRPLPRWGRCYGPLKDLSCGAPRKAYYRHVLRRNFLALCPYTDFRGFFYPPWG